ncbi:hypothetical protein GPECTOR_67g297 [Gonium pectorale]|uniref:Transmembrane protein 138 n=1 Tax=Gonium pectorale TaxID=33097 RepID=A0A150G3N2_GONPE|nr:hypothetical protein GPECTOR_67g297 [Gonium pectorale]|eukprot:KXZ44457.1 hypothetical protein GPECTOR_67g297 [Gonium pectorale]
MEKTIFKLATRGKHSTRVQAWTNPTYDTPEKKLGSAGDAAITVQPSGGTDLIDEMFPSATSLMRRLQYQFWAVIVLIVAHVMVTGYTDPLYTRAPLTQVIVYSGQVGLLLAIVMGFFLLTSQTLYIQLGRYDLYLREFAPIYGLFLAELALYVVVKVYATVALLRRVSYLAMWSLPAYTALWTIQRVLLLLFWVAAAHSATSVFNVRFFDPELLLGLHQQAKDQQRGARASPGR